MYNHTLKSSGEVFAQAQDVTATATLGNKNIKAETGAHLGGLAVSVLANTPVTAAPGSQITVSVESSADTNDANFKPLAVFATTGTPRYVAGFTAAEGQKLAAFPLPEGSRYARVKLSGSGITGKVDCLLEYLAR